MAEGGLTSSQRAFLRSAGRGLTPAARVGRAGASSNVVEHVRGLLAGRELVKVRLAAVGADRRPAAEALAAAVGAHLVDLVGRNAVLYRPDEALPPTQRLALPES